MRACVRLYIYIYISVCVCVFLCIIECVCVWVGGCIYNAMYKNKWTYLCVSVVECGCEICLPKITKPL